VAVPGFSLHEEIFVTVEHGLTPLRALQAATLYPAQVLRIADSLGTVAAGKVADLVLLDADPLADIYNTLKIRAVVANGRYFDRAALDTLLLQASKAS
jgi:imidazolonepropionase-like amidohydrolase